MNGINTSIRWGLLLAATSLIGCGSAPPTPTTWLALPAVTAGADHSDSTSATTPWVVVQRLRVPEYLQTTALRYRDGLNSFAEWPQARWAERVEVNLTRHLAQSLQALRPGWRWCEAPCSAPGAGTVQVSYQSLEIQRAAGEVVAVVQWHLQPPGPRVPEGGGLQGQWQHRQAIDGDTPEAQVAALARINKALAESLVKVLNGSPPPASPLTPTSAPTPSPGA